MLSYCLVLLEVEYTIQLLNNRENMHEDYYREFFFLPINQQMHIYQGFILKDLTQIMIPLYIISNWS